MELARSFDLRSDISLDYNDLWSTAKASYVYASDDNAKTK